MPPSVVRRPKRVLAGFLATVAMLLSGTVVAAPAQAATATVSGVVTIDGGDVRGFEVWLSEVNVGGDGKVASVISSRRVDVENDGTFFFTDVQTGKNYTLAGMGAGAVYTWLGGALERQDAAWFTLASAGTSLEFEMVRSAEVTGLVTDEAGNPVHEAYVNLLRWDEAEDRWTELPEFSGVVENGQLTARGVFPGRYAVSIGFGGALVEGYYDQYVGGAIHPPEDVDDPTVFKLTPGGNHVETLRVKVGSTVSGTLVAPGGVDLTALVVHLIEGTFGSGGLEMHRQVAVTTPDAEGAFSLPGAGPGRKYTVEVYGVGVFSQVIGGATDPHDAQWFDGGTDRSGVVFELAGAGNLTGNVLAPDGKPLNGTVVTARRWTGDSWTDEASTTASWEGSFGLYEVPIGDYLLWFDTDAVDTGVHNQFLGGARTPPSDTSDPMVLRVAPGYNRLGDVQLIGYGVTGKVGNLEDVAAADLEVQLFEAELGGEGDEQVVEGVTLVDSTEVGTDGTYQFRGLVSGRSYTIAVDGAGLVPEFYGASDVVGEARWFVADKDSTGVDVDLVHRGGITGVVLDPDAAPLEGVQVEVSLWDQDRASWRPGPVLSTDEAGRFEAAGLRPGSYAMWFDSRAASTSAYDQYRGGATALPSGPADPHVVTVTPEAPADLTVQLEAGSGLTGTAVVPPGTAPGDVEVTLYSAEGPIRTTRLGTGGDFALSGMAPGTTYTVGIEGDGLVPWFHGGELSIADAVWFSAAEAPEVAVTLERFAALLGTVRDSAGAPAPDVEIDVLRWDGAWQSVAHGRSDADGAYSFETLPGTGAYTLRFDPPRASSDAFGQYLGGAVVEPGTPGVPVDATQMIDLAEGQRLDRDLTLHPGVSMTGTAVIPGQVAPGSVSMLVHLIVTGADGVSCVAVDELALDPTGDYVVTHLAPGESYTLSFSGDDVVAEHLGGGTSCESARTFVAQAAGTVPQHVLTRSWSVAGPVELGGTLKAVPAGEPPTEATVTYQWLRDGQKIEGETASTYVLTVSDVGAEITVRVTVGDEGRPATSLPVVLALGTLKLPAPAISGSASVGNSLRAVAPQGVPTGATLGYQWLRGGKVISGATAAQYTVTLADVGAALSVRVTVALPGYAQAVVTSPPTASVARASSSVALRRSKAKQAFGAKKPVTLTATVTVQGGSQARGKVVFRAGKTTLGTASVSHGKATLRLKPRLKVATHRVTAQFVPAHASVTGSTSSAVSVKVTKAKAKVTAKFVKKSVKAKARARVAVKVTAKGIARVTGKLVVFDGKKKIRTVSLKKKHRGKITIKLPRLSKGKHRIKVVYQASKNVRKKASKVVTLRVR